MVPLVATAEGLRSLAAQCAVFAGQIAHQVPSPATAPSAQATAAAVIDAYDAVEATTDVLATHIRATGEKLAMAADRYMTVDEAASHNLTKQSANYGWMQG